MRAIAQPEAKRLYNGKGFPIKVRLEPSKSNTPK